LYYDVIEDIYAYFAEYLFRIIAATI